MEALKPLKEKMVLDRETQNKVNFMTFMVRQFAAAYNVLVVFD
jgi:hypothetical protein